MFKKCEHRTDILRSHQTTHVQLCIVNMVSPDVEQRLRSGRRGEPFSHEPAESVRSLRLTGLTSLQMDSLVLGDTRVLFCLRFHGLLDNNEKSAPVDSRARGCQPWGRWPPCPCSLPRSLPTPLTWCQPFHSCTWPHLVTHPRPENISSLPAPPPSSTSSLPFFIRSSLHFENLLPQTMSQASCLSGCFPWDHHLVVLTARRPWVHSFRLWFRLSRPRFELDHDRGMSVWLWHSSPVHVATADLCSPAHLPSGCFCGWQY